MPHRTRPNLIPKHQTQSWTEPERKKRDRFRGSFDQTMHIYSSPGKALALAAEEQESPSDATKPERAFRKNRPSSRDWSYLAKGLSDKERELLEALILPDITQIQDGALRIGMDRDDAYHVLLRIKAKYAKAKGYKNEVDFYWAKLRKQGKEKWLEG